MSRREINIFGTSFLDLLSGALAAVIILFVIVPKKTQADIDVLNEVQELQTVANDVKDAIEKIKNSIPKEVFEKIKEDIDRANQKITELQNRVNNLEQKIRELTNENVSLKEKVVAQQAEIEQLKKQLAELTKTLNEEKEKNEKANSTATALEKTLGVFAKFGIICKWDEMDADVDLGVYKFGESAGWCFYAQPSKSWGTLGEDLRERNNQTGDKERFELFYIPKIYYGEYTIIAQVFDESRRSSAKAKFVIIFHPGKPDEQKKEIGPVELSKGGFEDIASFRLSENKFEMIETKRPPYPQNGHNPSK